MNIFIRIFYNFALCLVSIIYLIKYLIRGRSMRDLVQRFYLPKATKEQISALNKRPIWFHAVSVGEINVLATYLDHFVGIFPEMPIVISTITPTGYDVANLKLSKFTNCIFYFPLDIYPVVNRFCNSIRPAKFVAMETELWPELYANLNQMDVDICILNGRLSDKSFPRYLKHKKLLKPIMQYIHSLGAQNDIMKERFKAIGLAEEKITITGNIKYAIKRADNNTLKELAQKWSILSNKRVIIAGSTHSPEEEYILEAFNQLNQEFSDTVLFLCPRHVERAEELRKLCEQKNLSSIMHSQGPENLSNNNVIILDQIGYLTNLYSLADIVLIGGSFIPHGGQNFLEPAVYAKATIVGPHMHNFKDIAEHYINNEGLVQIKDPYYIYNIFKELLTNHDYARNIGDNAMKLLSKEAKSIELSNKLIADLFS